MFGAVVLGFHGLARATPDLDLFIPPERDNVERLKAGVQAVLANAGIVVERQKFMGIELYVGPYGLYANDAEGNPRVIYARKKTC